MVKFPIIKYEKVQNDPSVEQLPIADLLTSSGGS